MSFGRVFITVGTTEFDEFIKQIDSDAFVDALRTLSCTHLVLQIGRGAYEPINLGAECTSRGMMYTCFRFKPTLDQEMRQADLIISHCGAGSIIECITLEKPFIVVVNSTLQGNHQTELADALAAGNHCISTLPEKILSLLCHDFVRKVQSLRQFPHGGQSSQLFAECVDSLFDFN